MLSHIQFVSRDLEVCVQILFTGMQRDLSGQSGARKGHAIAPHLEREGIEYTIVGRQGQGYATGVLITRIP